MLGRNDNLISKNPAGFLRKSIEENYAPPKDYVSPKEKERQAKKQAEQKQKEQKEKEREYKNWLQQTPEQRVQHKVDFWLNKERNLKKREPSKEEIKTKQQEYIECEPTPEEKQKQLFGKVIFK